MDLSSDEDDDWFSRSEYDSYCDSEIDLLYQRYLEEGLDLSDKYSTPVNDSDDSKTIYSFSSSQKLPDQNYIELCKSKPDQYKRCSLEIIGVQEAECTPLDDYHYPPEKIYISGRSKCGQAFNEDIVVVEILSNVPSSVHRKEGKVVTVVERTRYEDIDHPIFVCTPSDMERKMMFPACKTVPKIRISNRHVLRERQKEEKYLIEIYKYDVSEGCLRFDKFFKIMPDKIRTHCFLVAFLRWDTACQYPLGAVIGVIDGKGSNALRIAEIQHRVRSFYPIESVNAINEIIWKEEEHVQPSDVDDTFVFTIDRKNTKIMDDGFSVEVLENSTNSDDIVYKVGVHIADVCRLVQKDDPIDMEARERCKTICAGMGAKPSHMIPECLSKYKFSLQQGKLRHVFSFNFEMTKEGEVLKFPKLESIKHGVIKPRKNLCYEEVQNVLFRDHIIDVPDLSEKVKIMFHLATKLRINRLDDAHYAFQGNVLQGTNEDNDIHEARYLVEEFMILTNQAMAHMLRNVYPNHIPLRVHGYPDPKEIRLWLEEQCGVENVIMSLQNRNVYIDETSEHIIGFENGMRNINNNRVLPVDCRAWEALKDAFHSNDERKLKILLRTDDHHPKQCVALQKWNILQRKATYIRDRSHDDNHFGLRLRPYTTGTSPIRKYTDLVIQRFLLAAIENAPDSPYTEEEVDHICARSNKTIHKENQLYQQYRTHIQATGLVISSVKVSAVVVGLPGQQTIELIIPGYSFSEEPFHLRFNLLGLSSQPKLEPNQGKIKKVFAEWKKRIYDSNRIYFHDRKEIEKKFTIDPHGNTVSLRYVDWISLLCASIEDGSEKLRSVFSQIVPPTGMSPPIVDDDTLYASDVSSEVPRNEYILKHLCHFQRVIEVGQRLTVQIEAQPKHGSLVPNIQLVYATDTVAFCLPHVVDPILCLSRYVTRPTKLTYRDEADYIRIWTPILEMEEVTNIVRNEDSPLVKNVPVAFETPISGTFTLYSRFCRKRNIDLGFHGLPKPDDTGEGEDDNHNKENDEEVKFIPVLCSDFLCIRCSVRVTNDCKDKENSDYNKLGETAHIKGHTNLKQTYDWVGHARTTKIRRLGEKTSARFEIGFSLHNSPAIPGIGTYNCTLELLVKSNVSRRAEHTIKKLWDATDLAKAIALGSPIPNLDPSYSKYLRRLPRDVIEPNVDIPRNNNSQQVAINNALKSPFSLIQGPPGTGKTFTGIKLVYLFHQLNKMAETTGERRQILYCGPSNKSVDLVARWMKEKFINCEDPRMVRFYSQSYECVDFPIPGRVDSSQRSLRNAKPDPFLKDNGVVLHYLIRESGKKYAGKLKEFDNTFKTYPYAVTFEDVEEHCARLAKATVLELQSSDVIFCTTAMAANPKLLKATKGRIYQCIIDESGMCTEPETMVPIIATEATQVVLIGDHKQLQPIILSRAARELGLDISLFERYAKLERHLTMLNQQYRMNPWICSFPSKEFYNDRLVTDQTYRSGWFVHQPLKLWNDVSPSNHKPIAFIHVEGKETTLEVSTEDGNEKSRSNEKEVKKVVAIITYLVTRENVSKTDIRVLSQYNAQRQLIQKKLSDVTEDLSDVRVDTVVASQGGESDYIILSTVRSMPRPLIEHRPALGWRLHHLGFITDTHQINVALTRAKKGLIIVGNKHLLRCGPTWNALLNFYEAEQRMFKEREFPPP
ncbi:LOW QUALITY PROTEIN: 3'-5' exoribonuclease HELZ2-like [Argopecten irradians]|uniref:LOW QUALITY PROTEIN: 3'-5' exoribonuclease HELZ2-like n=1 Tax=Argopecten irradians TaxID=31199 RepID=UPI003713EAFE